MDVALSVIFLTALYFTPTIVAAIKHKRNLVAILMMDLLLGWTVIGWIVALIWALTVDIRKYLIKRGSLKGFHPFKLNSFPLMIGIHIHIMERGIKGVRLIENLRKSGGRIDA